MKRLLVIGLLTLLSTTSVAAEYPWKNQTPFEISFVDGYKEVYSPAEDIVFFVEGKSPLQVDAEPKSGFGVQATVTEIASTQTYSTKGKYDEDRKAWKIRLWPPKDPAKTYQINIYLYCANNDSPCADIYGKGAVTSKQFPLLLASSGYEAEQPSSSSRNNKSDGTTRLAPPADDGVREILVVDENGRVMTESGRQVNPSLNENK